MSPQNSIRVTANKTLVAADSGIVQNVNGDGVTPIVITLPTSVAGLTVEVANNGKLAGGPVGSGASKSAEVVVRGASGDGIAGLGFTAAINKGARSLKTNHLVGDRLIVTGTGATGASAWVIDPRTRGPWVREA